MNDVDHITLNIHYRITCEKTNPLNMCQDRKRTLGFYWKDANATEKAQIVKTLLLSDVDSISSLQGQIKGIDGPKDSEAIMIDLIIYHDNTKNGNGRIQSNTTFHYFRELKEDNSYEL